MLSGVQFEAVHVTDTGRIVDFALPDLRIAVLPEGVEDYVPLSGRITELVETLIRDKRRKRDVAWNRELLRKHHLLPIRRTHHDILEAAGWAIVRAPYYTWSRLQEKPGFRAEEGEGSGGSEEDAPPFPAAGEARDRGGPHQRSAVHAEQVEWLKKEVCKAVATQVGRGGVRR